jgi:hypothetical protein
LLTAFLELERAVCIKIKFCRSSEVSMSFDALQACDALGLKR